MSVFRGSIAEYPGVVVDHFGPANCERGRVFFLSHCHRDHMTGLNSPNIVTALRTRNTHLLCSEVTQSLLRNDPEFVQLAPYLRGLCVEEPIAMQFPSLDSQEELNFTVTLLPAGHCPGSTMFLFQGPGGNVLYTGDFRLTLEQTKRLKPLHCHGSLIGISTLYIDTTFYHPIATNIPSRETSKDIILKIIESWLAKDRRNVVHLKCASFGYEHIFLAIHQKFKTKVHIAPWKMRAYQEISVITDCVTNEGGSTNIHSCIFQKNDRKESGLPCDLHRDPARILRIKPSTQWFLFRRQSITRPCVYLPQANMYRVIHSMHASFNELKDFISYVRPSRVVPCVVPFGDSSLSDVCSRLKENLPQTEVGSGAVGSEEERVKLKRTVSERNTITREDTIRHGECVSDEDGWSTGDESIDEYVTSEEQTVDTGFTHDVGKMAMFSLPSLVLGSEDPKSPSPSLDSDATVGVLMQSPIDISLTPSLESIRSHSPPPTTSSTILPQSSQSNLTSTLQPPLQTTPPDTLKTDKTGLEQSTCCSVATPPSKRTRITIESPLLVPRKLFTSSAVCKIHDNTNVENDGRGDVDKFKVDIDMRGGESKKQGASTEELEGVMDDEKEEEIEELKVEEVVVVGEEEEEEEETEEEAISSPDLIDLTEDEEDETQRPPLNHESQVIIEQHRAPPVIIDLTDDDQEVISSPLVSLSGSEDDDSLPPLSPPSESSFSSSSEYPESRNFQHGQMSQLKYSQSSHSQRSNSVECYEDQAGSPSGSHEHPFCLPPTPGRKGVPAALLWPNFK